MKLLNKAPNHQTITQLRQTTRDYDDDGCGGGCSPDHHGESQRPALNL